MNSVLKLAMAAALMVLLAAWSVNAAGAVRISSDIENETASFEVSRSELSRTEVNLDIPAVGIVPVNLEGREYKKIQLPAADHIFEGEIAEDGMPDLPVITTNLAVPDMAGINFTVDYESYEIISNVEIAPAQPPQLESSAEVPPFTINSEFYSRDEYYPAQIAEVLDPVIMRDIRMVQVAIYPVQYNPAKKQIKVYRNISVNLTYDGENVVNPKTRRTEYLSEAFYPIYQSTVANFDELFSTLDVRRGGILIIAKDAIIDTLEALANWKHRKGYYVTLTPTTEIAPGGYPNYSQVYNYINNAYDTWEIPPEFVMIVGDISGTYGIPDYTYGYYNSDHHYACVDGNDYLPDLAISRLSISTLQELRIALAKILNYENNPYMEDINHWRRGFSSAGNIGSVTPRLTVLWVRDLLLEYGFNHVDTCFGWSTTPNPLMNTYFNAGPSIISYRGWGFTDRLGAPAYYISDLNQIPNENKLGILASLTCGTGDFGASLCFGEHWIRMGASTTQYKGGPCFYGSTDHGTHTRWNNPIMVGYYWAIFKENNYHFAAAAVRGKIQQYNTFPRYVAPGGDIEKYFHTYNMLGDPELSIRTQPPIIIAVTCPQEIDLGLNHVYVNVMDGAEHPVEGAYVTLYKEAGGAEELWVVGRTDANGDVTLVFDPPTVGDMMLTVSGRDLFPYQGTIEVVSGNTIVGYDTHDIDDDNSGYSSGNGDGIANPGETIELSINLKNFGSSQTASGVAAILVSLDEEEALVYRAGSGYADILPGQSVPSSNPFVVKIMPKAQHGDIAHLLITATDSGNNTWESSVEIPVAAPKFIVTGVAFSDANNRLDPGETLNMTVTLQNQGSLDAVGVTAAVYTMDDYTSLPGPTCSFGDIPSGGSGNNSGSPLIISSDSETFDGHTINLVLHTETAAGYRAEIPFSVPVGQVLFTDPTGPDAYGYHMFDNTDVDYGPAPTYNWAAIAPQEGGQGTRLNFQGTPDDGSTVITLPFDFVYYGEHYGALMVCTNGFAALDTFSFDMGGNHWWNFFNWPIPDPGSARGQISPFWDDLSYSGSYYGVFTWYDSDSHRFIIEWYHMTHRNTSATETFEMIITDPQYHPTLTGDSEIIFQYNTIYNNDSGENYSSVGFESWSELMGLEYTYDNFYTPGSPSLGNNKAIKITTNTGWGGIRGTVDLNNSGFNGGVTVTTSYGRFRNTAEDGSYWLRNVPPGVVDLTADIRGWFPSTITGLNVVADITAEDVDFNMTQCDIPGNLEASEGLGDRIELTWNAVSHADLVGYNIYRADWENGDYTKLNNEPVAGNAYTDNTVPDNEIYWYVVTAVYSGSYGDAESIDSEKAYGSTVVTGIEGESPAIPREFFISQNYPNPFNPRTTLSYGLPEDSQVRIDIFNVLGQRVVTLVDGYQTAGYKSITWNGQDSRGASVSSGIYFYTIEAGNFHDSRKMLLIK